ncbi:MAG: hypothetical protein N2C12_15410, partial [Planctomycetales bacterium]
MINAGETSAVQVNNVAPTIVLDPVEAIDENGIATLTGTITDPGTLDTFTVDINWGDSSLIQTFTYAAGTTSFTATHQYLDDNPSETPQDSYTISASVTDDDGGTDALLNTASNPLSGGIGVGDFNWPFHRFEVTTSDTHINTVGGHFSGLGIDMDVFAAIVQLSGANDNPDALNLTGTDVLATTLIPLTTSPGLYTGDMNLTLQPGWYALQFGTGAFGAQATANLGFSPSLTYHTTDLVPSQPVVVAIQNGHPTFITERLSVQGSTARFVINAGETSAVQVNNVAPTIVLDPVEAIDENGIATLTGTITDPGTLDTFTVDINWGDSSLIQT